MSIVQVIESIDFERAKTKELGSLFAEKCDLLIAQVNQMKAGFAAAIEARDKALVAIVEGESRDTDKAAA